MSTTALGNPGDFTSPTVAQGMVFTGTNRTVDAFAIADGSRRWQFPVGAPVPLPVTVAGGVVYAGSTNGVLYAIDASSGALLWQLSASAAINSVPVVAAGMVCVSTRD